MARDRRVSEIWSLEIDPFRLPDQTLAMKNGKQTRPATRVVRRNDTERDNGDDMGVDGEGRVPSAWAFQLSLTW